jgi:hypothetical protein
VILEQAVAGVVDLAVDEVSLLAAVEPLRLVIPVPTWLVIAELAEVVVDLARLAVVGLAQSVCYEGASLAVVDLAWLPGFG